MSSYEATVSSSRAADDVFSYLADFRTVAEWDPSITRSTRLDAGGDIEVGARYKVVTSTLGRDTELEYETVELQRPTRIVLRGENSSAISDDTITIAPRPDGGCDVTYRAELELKGLRKIAEPLVGAALQRLGAKAKTGLEQKLNP